AERLGPRTGTQHFKPARIEREIFAEERLRLIDGDIWSAHYVPGYKNDRRGISSGRSFLVSTRKLMLLRWSPRRPVHQPFPERPGRLPALPAQRRSALPHASHPAQLSCELQR